MFTFLKNVKAREALRAETPALAASFLVAELFFKFGSFTLECVCFLATWLVFGAVLSTLTRRVDARRESPESR